MARGRRRTVAIAGAGSLARVLAISLKAAGYRVTEILSRPAVASQRRASVLAAKVNARAINLDSARLDCDLLWLCVPDDNIRDVSRQLAGRTDWRSKIVVHASGALSSNELKAFKSRGAAVASVHPMNTFIGSSKASLQGIPFAAEGDKAALNAARRVVRDLGGTMFTIRKHNKVLYHVTGSLSSPLLVALLSTAEETARRSGIERPEVLLEPIVRQTVENFFAFGADEAFSGPLRRGDVQTIRQHLKSLQKHPEVRRVYLALAQQAVKKLPAKNRSELKRLLEK